MLILLGTTIVFFMITSVVTSDDKVPSLFYIMEFLECTINIPKYLRVWTACITAGLKYLLASNSRLMSSVLSSGSQFNSLQSPLYICPHAYTCIWEWVFFLFFQSSNDLHFWSYRSSWLQVIILHLWKLFQSSEGKKKTILWCFFQC